MELANFVWHWAVTSASFPPRLVLVFVICLNRWGFAMLLNRSCCPAVTCMTFLFVLESMIVSAAAQPVRRPNLPFGPRRANPQEVSYELTQQAGPWLIICTSFTGETAEEQALALCEELRTAHQLRPYIYRQVFAHDQAVPGIMPSRTPHIDASGRAHVKPKMMRPQRNRQDEVAVLVGDFPTLEDHRAQQVLEKIKHLHPQTLVQPEAESSLALGEYRRRQVEESDNRELTSKGPMRAAFLLANPLLPDEYFEAVKVDPFIVNLNRRAENSLLKASGTYTVRVATFRGDSTFDLSKMEEIEREQQWRVQNNKPLDSSKLVEATVKATLLAKELRKIGVEAYEFHNRTESIVCVGSFDWWMKPDDVGNPTYNPDMLTTMESFRGRYEKLPNGQTVFLPRSVSSLGNQGLFFDIEPKAIAVPRATASTRTSFFR